MSHYRTLGLSDNATEEQVRKAYRKLASKHHPDKAGGDTSTFQSIQVAYDAIEKAGFRHVRPAPPPPPPPPQGRPGTAGRRQQWEHPRNPGNTWRDKEDIGNIFEEMKEANRKAARTGSWEDAYPNANTSNGEKVATVTMREAFSGFNMLLPGATFNDGVNIPAGLPNGYRARYTTTSGKSEYITLRIITGDYRLKALSDENNLFSAGLTVGDIELDITLDAIDLITGTWIKVQDFLGEKLDVRVPAGHNPLHRLKIAGKGYYGWLHEYTRPSNARQDMYIKVNPVYNKPADIDRQKIIDLYNLIQGTA